MLWGEDEGAARACGVCLRRAGARPAAAVQEERLWDRAWEDPHGFLGLRHPWWSVNCWVSGWGHRPGSWGGVCTGEAGRERFSLQNKQRCCSVAGWWATRRDPSAGRLLGLAVPCCLSAWQKGPGVGAPEQPWAWFWSVHCCPVPADYSMSNSSSLPSCRRVNVTSFTSPTPSCFTEEAAEARRSVPRCVCWAAASWAEPGARSPSPGAEQCPVQSATQRSPINVLCWNAVAETKFIQIVHLKRKTTQKQLLPLLITALK